MEDDYRTEETSEKRTNFAADERNRASLRRGVLALGWGLLLIPTLVGALAALLTQNIAWLIPGVIVGFLLATNMHIVLEWESAVVLRFGKLHRIQGPGLFFTFPLSDFVAAYVDQRVTATPFNAEKTLTADGVPVDVDAVLFWMVWDPKSACTQVKNYHSVVFWAAQTALRDAIGNIGIAELSTRRKAVDEEIKAALTKKTEDWGITVTSVEIRDIVIPADLQDALSKEAQAERERNARISLAEAEEDISEMFVRASAKYEEQPGSAQLRAMSMLYDGVKENGGLVLVPTSLADAFRPMDNPQR